MKSWLKRQLALMLAVIMCLSLVTVPASAAGDEELEASAPSVVEEETPESVSVQVENGDLEQGDFSGTGDFVQDGEASGDLEVDEGFLSAGEPQEGDVQVDTGGNDADLNFGEDPTTGLDTEEELNDFLEKDVALEDVVLELEEGESSEEDENDSLGAFGASVSADRGEVVMSKGASTGITIKHSGGTSLKVGIWKSGSVIPSDGVTFSWGNGSNGKKTLNINAKKTGTYYVEVFIFRGIVPCDVAQIKVNVCNASLTCNSNTSVQVAQGGSKTLTFSASGCSGSSMLTYTTNNPNAFTCSLSSNKLTIYGKAPGSGQITVYYKSAKTGDVLKSLPIYVTTVGVVYPKVTVSPSYVSLSPGMTKSVKVSYSGCANGDMLRIEKNNPGAVDCTWNSQNSVLNIKGKANGSGTVKVKLVDASGREKASASVAFLVAPQATISPSTGSITLTAGKSGKVGYTLKNVTSQHSITVLSSNSKICTASMVQTNGNYQLVVTGKNAGTAGINVVIKDARGGECCRALLNVTVKPAPPTVKASQASVNMTVGQQGFITFTYANCSGKVSMGGTKSSGCVTTQWGNWNGASLPMTIKAVEPGTCTINVDLKQNGKVVATTSVKITVKAKESKNRLDIKSISYGFENYPKKISLQNYQRIFGYNQYAQQLHDYHEKNAHGVCFGMATSSVLLYENTVHPTQFGAYRTSELYESDLSNVSSALGIKLSDFIEMMYTTQLANAARGDSVEKIDQVAKLVMNDIDRGHPVTVGMSSNQGGHRVTAIGYSLSGNTLTLDIYDNNYPNQIRALTITRPSSSSAFNDWAYSGNYKRSNGYTLKGLDTSSIQSVWKHRGDYSAVSNWNLENEVLNLVCTEEDTFSLVNFDGDTVAKFDNGELVTLAENAYMIPVVESDGNEDVARCVLVPQDYYFVEDGTPQDGISISIASETLSTSLNMEESPVGDGAIGFCAVDQGEEPLATASISVADGAAYSINIGMTDEKGESSNITKEGIGYGGPIGLSLSGDQLSLGLADEPVHDAVVTETPAVPTYEINTLAWDGGTISSESGKNLYKRGEDALYTIQADEGYTVSNVFVDGEDVGPVSSWAFGDIKEDHDIEVIFKQNLENLTLSLNQESFGYTGEAVEPAVTLTDAQGNSLVENEDFIVVYDNNVEAGKANVLVMATADSSYYGVLETEFTIEETLVDSAKAEGKTIHVTMKDGAYAQDSVLMAAVYDENGKMVYVETKALQIKGESLTFELKETLKTGDTVKLFALSADGHKPLQTAYKMTIN